jgi:hypothetical protein
MIICPYCVRPADLPDSKFCQFCGKLLSAAKTPVTMRRQGPRLGQSATVLIGSGLMIAALFFMTFLAVRLRLNIGRNESQKSLLALRTVEPEKGGSTPEALRARLLGYIARRNNSGQDFEEQLLGQARMELYKPETHEVWFALPATSGSIEAAKKEISHLLADPAQIESAIEVNGRLSLGDFALDKRPDRAFLFKTSEENIRFDPERLLSFKYDRATYTVTLREAVDYLTNRNAQGGRLQIKSSERINGRMKIFFNHGTFAARRGEPSLVRLAQELIRDIPASAPEARERRVQRLVDFVSQEIVYDDDEAGSGIEILKHPVETLISRHGDCSNKAILLGSLLEQLEEDYLFVYCPEHITVAVKQGRFGTDNELTLRWENQMWVIAEATAPGFQIGLSRLDRDWILRTAEYIQRPAQQNVVFDVRTGRRAEFR